MSSLGGAALYRTIVEKHNDIPEDALIGINPLSDLQRGFTVVDWQVGVTEQMLRDGYVPNDTVVPRRFAGW